ncbi:MAG: gliding motility-associated C-terminal domain-containing protein, partial [Bacteroidales bacterium]|nr:gliding motility-associated C-terminal domain-containing protein [Bacteroidales bacterium]
IIPGIKNNALTADQNLCETEHPVSLKNGDIAGGDGDYKYQWQSSETGTDWNPLPNTTEDLQPEKGYTGDRYYIRTVNSGPCTSTSSTTLVHFDKTPSDAIITSPAMDTTLHFKFSTIVNVAPISDGIGTWKIEGTGSLSDSNVPNSKNLTGLDIGSNTILTWTVSSDNGYCPDKSAQVSVIVKDITIPSGFSPNNDQINDCFGVLGSNHAEHFDLVIINRNNKVIFQTSSLISVEPYPCLWEGKDSSGNDLPSGTYFYRLTLTGSNQKKYLKTGYVTLKK